MFINLYEFTVKCDLLWLACLPSLKQIAEHILILANGCRSNKDFKAAMLTFDILICVSQYVNVRSALDTLGLPLFMKWLIGQVVCDGSLVSKVAEQRAYFDKTVRKGGEKGWCAPVLWGFESSKWPIVTYGVPCFTPPPPPPSLSLSLSVFSLPSPIGYCRKRLLSYSSSSRYRVIKCLRNKSQGHPQGSPGKLVLHQRSDIDRLGLWTHTGKMDRR